MVLTGKEKAVVAFIITLITGGAVIVAPYITTDLQLVHLVQAIAAFAALVGTTLGVYATVNAPTNSSSGTTTPPVATTPAPVEAPDPQVTTPL